jgi:hypothetical protein
MVVRPYRTELGWYNDAGLTLQDVARRRQRRYNGVTAALVDGSGRWHDVAS